MAAHTPEKHPTPKPRKFHGWMAEFADEDSLLKTARKVRDAGYTETDAFTPFPVHGIDKALGIKPTVLPWIVLCMGMCGTITAFTMEIWMNAVSYPYIISGKPFVSFPAFVPVGFELTILFSAFTSFLGMLALNRLVKFSNPVFINPNFDRATNDRFFLFVNSKDKYFNKESVRELLASGSPNSLDEVLDDTSPANIPTGVWLGLVFLLACSLVPVAIVLNMRASRSDQPRWHVFFDMDFQPKKKAQSTTTIFADGRASRPQVIGTMARGQLPTVDPFYLGYEPEQIAMIGQSDVKLVVYQETQTPAENAQAQPTTPETPTTEVPANNPAAEPAPAAQEPVAATPTTPAPSGDNQPPAAPATSPAPTRNFLAKVPLDATDETMKLGRQKFETYCSACHGFAGGGDGLVSMRAMALNQGDWLQPTSLHDPKVVAQPVGQIFYTITNGKDKMASYATVLSPSERWAVVLYVKALQRANNAKNEDLPRDKRGSIKGSDSN